jgi:hypothetical protein
MPRQKGSSLLVCWCLPRATVESLVAAGIVVALVSEPIRKFPARLGFEGRSQFTAEVSRLPASSVGLSGAVFL